MLFEWDENKNKEIKRKHGISFESIVEAINLDFVVIDTPNKKRAQKAILVLINDYPIIVPFEIRGEKYRLITAWPDRRYKNE